MSLLAVKLRRDLRATWPRIVMMVVAVAISLTVFGAMLYAYSTADREISREYLSTDPASATILLERGIPTDRMAAIAAEARTRPQVIEATGRTQFTARIRDDGGGWRESVLQVYVAAPDDPMRIANFEVQQGAWPPAPGDILVRRDTLTLLDLAVGDTVAVETPSREPARLRVAGIVYDPGLTPATQEQRGTGYLSTESLAPSGRSAVLNQLKIQVADEPGGRSPSRNRDTIVAVSSDVGQWLQRDHGLQVDEIQVPPPYEHPHQGQADTLLIALLVGGAAALLLSTILVANMLNGLFIQQIPQIGIMKAIGARSARIGRLYLAMTLIVSASATLLALVPAILIHRAFVPRVFGFLGIEAASLTPPWWTYGVVLAAGLLLPPLMAMIPLIRTSRTTVRASIDHRGLGSEARTGTRVLAWLGRIRRVDRGLLMALRNTVRRPARFLLSVGLLASAGILFVAGMSTSAGTEAIAEETKNARRWDVEVQLDRPTPVDQLPSIVERVPEVTRVESWAIVESGVAGPGEIPVTRTYPDQGHGRVSLTALPANTTMHKTPELLEGRWLRPQETGAIVLNQITIANSASEIGVGDRVQLSIDAQSTNWRVVGIAQERTGSGGAYVTSAGLAEATAAERQATTLRIVTDSHDERTRTAVAHAVDEVLTDASIEVRSAASVSQQEAVTEGHLGPIILVLLAIAVTMAVVGGIGLASTMTANILERTREFGVMHAIGALPKTVRRIVVAEGVFLALASCVVAVVPTLGLTAFMGAGLGNKFMYAPLPFRVSMLAAGIWIVVVILGAILATDAAATRASRLTVREALAYL